MGNILCSGGLLSSDWSGSDAYHVQVGKHALISLSQKQVILRQIGGLLEKWNISYRIGFSACGLELSDYSPQNQVSLIRIRINH